MSGRPSILLVLTVLFGVGAAGRGAEALVSLDAVPRSSLEPVTEAPHAFEALDDWSADLDERAEAIEARSIAADMALAEAKRHAARARAVQAEEHENAGRRQAALYGAMPPAKAAAVLSSLDADAAARILEAMPPQTAGAIVAAMTADSAKAVARAMSG